MSSFFISYSRTERQFARNLRKHILAIDSAHDVFLDEYGLTVGANLKATLRNRIRKCDYFILILSQNSLKSKWIQFEVDEVRVSELKTGQKKLFAIRLDDTDIGNIPKTLSNYLILDFANSVTFTSDFFRLMNGIYSKPIHFEVDETVANDPKDGGYLFSLKIACDKRYFSQIEQVEYRFDNEFEESEYNLKILESAVHLTKDRRNKFGVYNLWTSESIVVFVSIYLKSTRMVYIRKHVDVGLPVN